MSCITCTTQIANPAFCLDIHSCLLYLHRAEHKKDEYKEYKKDEYKEKKDEYKPEESSEYKVCPWSEWAGECHCLGLQCEA